MSPTEPDQFRLSGAWNFRDLGGLRTADGSVTRTGAVFRSSELTRLTESGRAELDRLGVRDVFDFRGTAEVERYGSDQVAESVTVHAVPFVNVPVIGADAAPHEPDRRVFDARGYLTDTYRAFPTLDGARIAVASVLRAVATSETPVLLHCAAGKDRAGWTAATVLRTAGVVDDDILADYLVSNSAVEPLRRHVLDHGAPADKLDDDLLGVREEYYRAGLDAMTEAHGSFDNYLDALGIDADVVAGVRRSLVTPPTA